MLPIFSPSANLQADSNWSSAEEIQAALERVRRQKLRLEERERQLLQALAVTARERVRELVDVGGLATPVLEGMLRRTVDSSRRGQAEPAPPSEADAIRARKAPLRYRHPDDPGKVWSGRGKTPAWVTELVAQGRLERARIEPDQAG